MEPFRHHVFVCTQSKPEGLTSCPATGSLPVLQALERELILQNVDDDVQVTTSGCLGLCDDGPVMIVYPEGTWYRKVCEADVKEIVRSHLKAGDPVRRLVWNDPPAMKAQAVEHRDRFRAMMRSKDEASKAAANPNK
jgi:(2Fe-2S) ferredoxin